MPAFIQNPDSVILPLPQLALVLQQHKAQGERIVLTNGCFDILHIGHVDYLERARALGDILVIALNSDISVRQLKGSARPLNNQDDRARILAALRCIDYITIFDSLRITSIIHAIAPHIYTKGGDYTVETLDPEERAALKQAETSIQILPLVPGRSTTALFEKFKKL